MQTTIVNPSLDRVGRGSALTAFERDVLPGFTAWLIEEVERRRPDYLIPVETKGARVLEAALYFAAERLGTPITVPVLYGIALAYIDPSELAELRLLIIDDAVRTGANLEHHRRRAINYGARDVQTIACIGEASEDHEDVDCYLTAEEAVYRQYVSQLAELVTARGLPPEVDHHVFEVRLPVRVAGAWGELARLLSRHGALTVDAPAESAGSDSGITLHFPRLPLEQVRSEVEGHEEIDKIRVFPDLAENLFHVIPVRFPALHLAEGVKETDVIDPEEALGIVGRLLPRATNPAALLVSEARTLNAKTLFRAISTGAEIESMIGFAAVLRETFPGARIEAHPESFARLYGESCGARVAAAVAEALLPSEQLPADLFPPAAEAPPPRFLEPLVVETTTRLVKELRELYDRQCAQPGHQRSERVGLSVPEIIARLGDVDPLLVSRCIDYGMAATTLVPFTGFDGDGETCVQRKYRVSEGPRHGDPESYADREDERVEISEQVAALLCHNLIERCGEELSSVAPEQMARLVAIMRPLVLERLSIPLCVRPADDRISDPEWDLLPLVPEVMLCADGQPVRLDERLASSIYVDALEGRIVPTPTFKDRYLKGELKVAIASSVEPIEAGMKNLLSLLAPLSEAARDELLEGWAKSTDHRLGITHVRHSLSAALALIEAPLRLIGRGTPHLAHEDTATLVDRHCRTAARKVEQLRDEWEKPVKDRWGESSLRLERAAVVSMAAPTRPLSFYQLPDALADLITGLGAICERLDRVSAELWLDRDDAETALEVSRVAVGHVAEVRVRLTSLEGQPAELPRLPEDPITAVAFAAEELFDLVRQIKAILAAAAGDYRGPQSARLLEPALDKRNSSVLSLDIAGSRTHEREHRATHNAWKNEGLDVAAQWARAFTGREGKHREGDDIWFEFAVGDKAVIAAALIQAHAAALASTGIDGISRDFHVAVDAGELEQGNVGSTNGPCMDRVTKIAKAVDRLAKTNHVFVSAEAWSHCSAGLHEAEVRVDALEGEVLLDDKETRIKPIAINSEKLLRRYCERLAEFAQQTSQLVASVPGGEEPIRSGTAEPTDARLVERSLD